MNIHAHVMAFREWLERNSGDADEWDEGWIDFARLVGRVLVEMPMRRAREPKENYRDALRLALDENRMLLDQVTALQARSTAERGDVQPAASTPSYVALVNEAEKIVQWGGSLMRVARCPDPATQCLACDRLGKHLEPVEPLTMKARADEEELAQIRALLIVPSWPVSTLDAVRAKVAESKKWASEVGRLKTLIAETSKILTRV